MNNFVSSISVALITTLMLIGGKINAGRLDTATYQLKVSPTKMLLGDYGVQYETAIASHLALNVGAGITYLGLVDGFPSRFRYGNGTQIPGVSGQISMRTYLKRAAANKGFSIELMYRYQRFHATHPVNEGYGLDYSSSLSDRWQVSANMHFSLNFMYQLVSKGNWVFAPYVGFGTMHSAQIYTFEKNEIIINNSNGEMSEAVIHERNKVSAMLPSLKAGIEIGILRFKK